MNIKEFLRQNCPDIPFIRKMANRIRINQYKKLLLSSDKVRMGEESYQARCEIIEEYSKKNPAYVAKMDAIVKDMFLRADCFQERNDLESMRVEMLFCSFAYGIKPDEYVYFGLEGKSYSEIKTYVSDVERVLYQLHMNDLADMKIFKDKELTYLKFKPYFQRDAIAVSSSNHWDNFNEFINKHPRFVKKPVFESCGHGVDLIDLENAELSVRQSVFNEMIAQGKHLLEELVIQSEEMAVLNASSVNTVRVFTFNTRNGVVVPFGFLRTGREGSFVDNAGSGGVFAAINTEKGIVMAEGCDELGRHYANHPSSGISLVGFSLPEWSQARELCCEMAALIPTVKFIGWDLAHTSRGWVVIEGNGGGQLVHQGSLGYGIKEQIEKIVSDVEYFV